MQRETFVVEKILLAAKRDGYVDAFKAIDLMLKYFKYKEHNRRTGIVSRTAVYKLSDSCVVEVEIYKGTMYAVVKTYIFGQEETLYFNDNIKPNYSCAEDLYRLACILDVSNNEMDKATEIVRGYFGEEGYCGKSNNGYDYDEDTILDNKLYGWTVPLGVGKGKAIIVTNHHTTDNPVEGDYQTSIIMVNRRKTADFGVLLNKTEIGNAILDEFCRYLYKTSKLNKVLG